jgi:hypothetical protein
LLCAERLAAKIETSRVAKTQLRRGIMAPLRIKAE